MSAVPGFMSPTFASAATPAYLTFLSPIAAAARNNFVYVVDAGHRQIFRYDEARQAITRFTDTIVTAASSIAVGPDLSLYITDLPSAQVQHFSWDGRQLPGFAHDIVLRHPVAVVVDDASSQVFVADSLYNHVVVFNSLGRALVTLRSDVPLSIESMARGPDGLYLVDRLGRQVVVMGLDGTDRYTFGSGTLKQPHAIVVDRFNRVFVGDDFDNTIKVFEGGELVATIGGSGAMAGLFNRITFLSLDRNTLYVADSLNGRIQSFQLVPPPVRRPVPQ